MEGPFLKWAPWWAMTRNGPEEKEKGEEECRTRAWEGGHWTPIWNSCPKKETDTLLLVFGLVFQRNVPMIWLML